MLGCLPSSHELLTNGCWCIAIAQARTRKSLTVSLTPWVLELLVELAAELDRSRPYRPRPSPGSAGWSACSRPAGVAMVAAHVGSAGPCALRAWRPPAGAGRAGGRLWLAGGWSLRLSGRWPPPVLVCRRRSRPQRLLRTIRPEGPSRSRPVRVRHRHSSAILRASGAGENTPIAVLVAIATAGRVCSGAVAHSLLKLRRRMLPPQGVSRSPLADEDEDASEEPAALADEAFAARLRRTRSRRRRWHRQRSSPSSASTSDDRAHVHLLALGHGQLCHGAVIEGLEFHRRFVGLDVGEDDTGGDARRPP
jgi:hypothetical protein